MSETADDSVDPLQGQPGAADSRAAARAAAEHCGNPPLAAAERAGGDSVARGASAAPIDAAGAASAAARTLLVDYTLALARAGHLGCGDDMAAAAALVDSMLRADGLEAAAAAGPVSGAASPASGAAAAAATAVVARPSQAAAAATANANATATAAPAGELRLTHSCRSTACGDLGCALCKFNTVQPCGRCLAPRYLADDSLRAACGAPVHVALRRAGGGAGGAGGVGGGAGGSGGSGGGAPLLADGTAVEVVVIDGERYDGLAPAAANCGGGKDGGADGAAAAAAARAIPFADVLRACAVDAGAAKGPLIRTEAGVPVLSAGGGAAATPWRARSAGRSGPQSSSAAADSAESSAGDDNDGAGAGAGAPPPFDRVVLLPQGGLVSLSGLRCCASSEAVLRGKGSHFRLALRAVDAATGAPLPDVSAFGGQEGKVWCWQGRCLSARIRNAHTQMRVMHAQTNSLSMPRNQPPSKTKRNKQVAPVVTEPFLVATRRMKQALKRDTPCTADEISRLHHVGRATAEKLRNLAAAAAAEGVDLRLPPSLARVERVGQFAALAALAAESPGTRVRLLQLLKLSAASWAEAAAHAASAVPPDGRRRLFACAAGGARLGLLFEARMGALLADNGPTAVVYADGSEVPARCVDARLAPLLPGLRAQALAAWRLPGHPGWGVYARDDADGLHRAGAAADPAVAVSQRSDGGMATATAAAETTGGAGMSGGGMAASAGGATAGGAVAGLVSPRGSVNAFDGAWEMQQRPHGAARAAATAALQPQPQPQQPQAPAMAMQLPAAVAVPPPQQQLPAPAPQPPLLRRDDSLKRDRSETAQLRASAMAEARARLLHSLRGGGGGDGAAANAAATTAAADAPAPWELDDAELCGGGGPATADERRALLDVYTAWQASLTLPPGGSAVFGAAAAFAAQTQHNEQQPHNEQQQQQQASVTLAGRPWLVAPGMAHPSDCADRAPPAAVVQSAPLALVADAESGAARRADLMRSISAPRGALLAGAAAAAVASTATTDAHADAPWLLGADEAAALASKGAAAEAMLCRGLRGVSFEWRA